MCQNWPKQIRLYYVNKNIYNEIIFIEVYSKCTNADHCYFYLMMSSLNQNIHKEELWGYGESMATTSLIRPYNTTTSLPEGPPKAASANVCRKSKICRHSYLFKHYLFNTCNTIDGSWNILNILKEISMKPFYTYVS